MEEVCPEAWLLNYTNPMSMVTGAILQETGIKAVGLCHSVQVCAETLIKGVGMDYDESIRQNIYPISLKVNILS